VDPDPDPHQNGMDPQHLFKELVHEMELKFKGIVLGLKVLSNGARGGPKLVSIDPFL
jgi:hypothetical protein